MTPVGIDALHARAIWLGHAYGLDYLGPGEAIIPYGDPRASDIEHACHELAHAALLGIRPQQRLEYLISDALKHYDELKHYAEYQDGAPASFPQLNEMKTFSVVIGALRRLGIPVDTDVMLDACAIQTHGHFSSSDISYFWTVYENADERAKAIETVAAQFEAT